MAAQSFLQIPTQRKSMEKPELQPGDWALLTKWTEKTVDYVRAGYMLKESAIFQEVYRGLVVMTPDTTPKHEIFTDSTGNESGRLGRLPLFHLAEVRLLEKDGDLLYDKHPDILLNPERQHFSIEKFDASPANSSAYGISYLPSILA